MTPASHLAEEDRQGAADGTLDAARQDIVNAHLAACAECAADVARLRSLMTQVRESPAPAASDEELWPSIRSRIEGAKVVPLDPALGAPARARRRGVGIAATIIAAALLIAAVAQMQRVRLRPAARAAATVDATFASVRDSSQAYEEESNRLLNELEMQRAMLRPNTSAALDSDLAVIDRSIAELQAAIARDPKNLALQRLLAASYREKVDLLRRANNADDARVLLALASAALLSLAPSRARGQQSIPGEPLLRSHVLKPRAPVKMFVPSGTVRIVGWDREAIEIRGRLPVAAQLSLTGTDSGVKLIIDEPSGKPAASSKLSIYMPRRSQLSLKTVDATVDATDIGGWFYTVSGSLRIGGSMSSVEAEAMSGDITLAAATPWARARTGAGHLIVTGSPEDVDAATIGGALDIATSAVLRGRFTSVTGDIRYASSFSPRSLFEFSDHSGTVEFLLPRDVSAHFELSSVAGEIENGFTQLRPAATGVRSLSLRLGAGDANVEVRTFKGAVRLRSR